ncbi:MAG: hypothetical protein Kow0077_30410 [Anaerolineae bacterium]
MRHGCDKHRPQRQGEHNQNTFRQKQACQPVGVDLLAPGGFMQVAADQRVGASGPGGQ